MRGLAASLAVLLSAAPAHAYLKAGPIGYGHWLQGSTVQQGMTTSLAAAYSFRKVRDAYAGSAVKLRRVDATTQDIGFTASGDFDTAAAAAFCTTACTVQTWFDQSGNARDVTQATAGLQPAYVANCIGTLPCMQTLSDANSYLVSGSVSWVAKSSLAAVAIRVSGTAACTFSSKHVALIGSQNAANQWVVTDQVSTSFNLAAADNGWHAGIGIIDGASSVGRIDETETAGAPVTGLAAAGSILLARGNAGTVCRQAEAIVWDNYALTLAERQALTANQIAYWTPLPLDTFQTPAAAYSMRRLRSAYTGPALRLRRASDNAEADIGFLGFTSFTGAPIDVAAANAHCAATTCTAPVWYDQSGGGRHVLTPTGEGLGPSFVFNCQNGLPCLRTTTAIRMYTGGNYTPVMPATLGAVGNRGAGVGACQWPLQFSANYLSAWATVPNAWVLVGASAGSVSAGAADAAWHAGVGVINGASSVLRIDTAETAGSTTGTTTASVFMAFQGSADTTCSVGEIVAWDGYGMPATERAALTANQKSFWGF